MSAYSIVLHVVACLWYVFFWSNFLAVGQNENDWDPKYRDIHEMGNRFLTNWNLVNQFSFYILLLINARKNHYTIRITCFIDTSNIYATHELY